ncbi:MAG: molybdopterin cofactor-binding domain-containing protein, partial [Candidatus Acidiferrum sp.]
MSARTAIGRRDFIKTGAAIGGGLLVSLYSPLPAGSNLAAAAEEKQFALNAFVRIGTDESVTVISAHSEMGQGIYTSLPMLLNEELEANWSNIRVEAAPVDKVYNHPVFGVQMTGGSTTSPAEWKRYREMGAIARLMLVQAAA